MPDRLVITDLEVWTRIGVPDAEREREQRLLVTIAMQTDASAVAAGDDVAAGIDYAAVAAGIRDLAARERRTIERFAEDAAAYVLDTYRPAAVEVTVRKFVIPGTRDVSLTITRP